MKYFTELSNAMKFLNKFKKTIFVGQAVSYAGTGMTNTLKDVSKKKKVRTTSRRRDANGNDSWSCYGGIHSNKYLS